MKRLLLLWVRSRVRLATVTSALLALIAGGTMAAMTTGATDLSPIYVILVPAVLISLCALLGHSELALVEALARPLPQLYESTLVAGSSAAATAVLGIAIFYWGGESAYGVLELARNWGVYMILAAVLSLYSWRLASIATLSLSLVVLVASGITRSQSVLLYPASANSSLAELGIITAVTLLVQAIVPWARRPTP